MKWEIKPVQDIHDRCNACVTPSFWLDLSRLKGPLNNFSQVQGIYFSNVVGGDGETYSTAPTPIVQIVSKRGGQAEDLQSL